MQLKLSSFLLALIAFSFVVIACSFVWIAIEISKLQSKSMYYPAVNDIKVIDIKTGKPYVYDSKLDTLRLLKPKIQEDPIDQ